jgi:hypothetical protein
LASAVALLRGSWEWCTYWPFEVEESRTVIKIFDHSSTREEFEYIREEAVRGRIPCAAGVGVPHLEGVLDWLDREGKVGRPLLY